MKYYVYKEDKIVGPFTREEIINNPQFDDDDLVRPEDSEYWYKQNLIFTQSNSSNDNVKSSFTSEKKTPIVETFEQSTEKNKKLTVNLNNSDIEKIFRDFLDNIETYLDYRNVLQKKRADFILNFFGAKYSENIEQMQRGVSEFIEFKVSEKERLLKYKLEEEYKQKNELELNKFRVEIKNQLLKQFEIEYELKINQVKKEIEKKLLDEFNEYKTDTETSYKNKYIKDKEQLISEIEPELINKYEKMFEDKKQDFITDVYNRIENTYAEKLRLAENIFKLETAIDYAKQLKEFKETYNADYRRKLRDELYNEFKETMMKTMLNEVKIERQKLKEDCAAQLEAERKLLELELKQELLKSKKTLKENADKYIEEQLNKKRNFD